MHVLINAASANMGGAVTYLKNVLRWMPEVAPLDRITVIIPKATHEKLELLPTFIDRIRIQYYPYANTGGLNRFYFDQIEIPRLVSRMGADVLFSSTGFATWKSPVPQVLLVRNPVYFSAEFEDVYRRIGRSLLRNRMRRFLSIVSIKRSDVVLFPTRAMQAMVEQHVSLDGRRSEAIHYGFDHEAFFRSGPEQYEGLGQVAAWKSEGYKIMLNVSTYAVHKNFETLVEGISNALKRGVRCKLLTTTSREKTADKREYDAMRARIADLGLENTIVELGYVPYEALSAVYAMADAFVFPSLTESFGHSMVESMAAGLPVIAADTAVNREICGDAAVYFRTHDGVDCGKAIYDLLTDDTLLQEKIERSKVRASHFSWKEYSMSLSTIFNDAVRSRQDSADTDPESELEIGEPIHDVSAAVR